jgi:hypothetical protein
VLLSIIISLETYQIVPIFTKKPSTVIMSNGSLDPTSTKHRFNLFFLFFFFFSYDDVRDSSLFVQTLLDKYDPCQPSEKPYFPLRTSPPTKFQRPSDDSSNPSTPSTSLEEKPR